MKRTVESTRPCLSPTSTVYGCDLIPATRTNFWTGIQCIGGQEQAAVNTALPQHSALPKAFLEGPGRMPFRSRRNGTHSKFVENLLESEQWTFDQLVQRPGRRPYIIRIWLNYVVVTIFKALSLPIIVGYGERCRGSCYSHLSPFLCMITTVCQSSGALATWHTLEHFRSDFITTCSFQCFDS